MELIFKVTANRGVGSTFCHQHEFAKLLLKQYHINSLHEGPQALLASIRQRFWIINGKSATTVVKR